jgi:hypothetical protein
MGAADDGHDVRVIDAGGEVLPYELETWDSVTGRIVWVRLPTLGAGISDRELTVYFAYPGAEADSGGDVWGDYQGVWHLGDGFQGAMQNSAPPAIDGQITGTTVEVGALAAARRFSPNQPSRIEFDEASYPLFSGWEAMSMSFWIEPDYATDSDWQEDVGRFLSRGGPITLGRTDDNDSDDGQGRIQIDVHFSGGHVAYLNTEIPRQAWSWMVWDYDGSVLRLYRDGQEVGQDTEVGPALESSDNAIIIGGSTDNNALDGLLDEFRVANVSRSPQWYEAQYRAMSGDMVSLGPVERCQ